MQHRTFVSFALLTLLFTSGCGDDGPDGGASASFPTDCTVDLPTLDSEGALVRIDGAREFEDKLNVSQFSYSGSISGTTSFIRTNSANEDRPQVYASGLVDPDTETWGPRGLSVEFDDGAEFAYVPADPEEGQEEHGFMKFTHREADDEAHHITFCGTIERKDGNTFERINIQGRVCEGPAWGAYEC